MSMQLSSENGFPETAVKARKRSLLTAVASVSHLIILILLAYPIKLELTVLEQ